MQTRVFKKPAKLVSVKAYQAKFGHLPAPEAYKFLSTEELERQAAEAISRGEPMKEWAARSQNRFGTPLDGFFS